jgi:photosystem II stability/assembly factor-like uncharacterized protein
MKKYYLLLLFCSLSVRFFAQGYWTQTSAPLVGDRYDDIYFLNDDTGWAVENPWGGGTAVVLKTQNGGVTWQQMAAPGTPIYRDIGFLNAQKGFIGILQADNDTAVMYRSVDSGNTWQACHNIPGPRPMGICGQNVINDSTLVGVGRYFGPAVFLKTTNSGSTWSYTDMSQYAGGLVDVLFFNRDTGIAVGTDGNYATGRGVVLYTTNGGNTWQVKKLSSRSQEMCWKISFPTRDTGYVSLESFRNLLNDTQYILKTVDGGLHWQELQYCVCGTEAQGIGFRNATEGWVGGRYPSGAPQHYVYHTLDGGNSWAEDSFAVNPNRFRFLNPNHGFLSGQRIYEYRNPSCIKHDTTHVEICQGQTYHWQGATFTNSGTLTRTLITAQGCDSITTLQLMVIPLQSPTQTFRDTTCLILYSFADTVFNFTNSPHNYLKYYTKMLKAVDGCDSLQVQIFLRFQKKGSVFEDTICAGHQYYYNGQYHSTSGNYPDTIQTIEGCDSLRTLHLVVLPPPMHNIYDTICHGHSYAFYDSSYTATGLYWHYLIRNDGCDSLDVLHLYVKNPPNSSANISQCKGKSVVYIGDTLTSPGPYTYTLSTATGCDSIVHLNLAFNYIYPIITKEDSICHGGGGLYNFNGHILTSAGIYLDTVSSSTGCDSIIAVRLSYRPWTGTHLYEAPCPENPYYFNGQQISTDGTYLDTIQGQDGCDSVTIYLSLQFHLPTSYVSASFCPGDSYTFNGHTYIYPGTYRDTLINNSACDTQVVLTLSRYTLSHSTTVGFLPSQLCIDSAAYVMHGYPAGGIFSGTGVINDSVFNPVVAGIGHHQIVYGWPDENGCMVADTGFITVTTCNSIKDIMGDEVRLYPNPAKGTLFALINSSHKISAAIIGANGNTDMELFNVKADGLYTISISGLAAGSYLIKIWNEEGAWAYRKLIIQ